MPLGQAKQTAKYAKPVAEAFADSDAVLRRIANVTESNARDSLIRAKAKYGLQTVEFRLRIVPDGNASTLEITTFGDDVWSAGARATIRNFLVALSHSGDTNYVPSANPMNPTQLVMALGAFALVLRVTSGSWDSIPEPVGVGILVLGFSAMVYSIVERWVFRRT